MKKLPRDFYLQSTLDVTGQLIGKWLLRRTADGIAGGMIVETEAYIGHDDPACHAAVGKTARNATMFGPPGHAYVYFTYGMYHCLNFVTAPAGTPEAILIRALDPVEGIELMQHRRGRDKLTDLTTGPGKLCIALDIDRSHDGADLLGGAMWVEDRGTAIDDITWTPRIGIRNGTEHLWRCCATDSRFLSKKLPAANRKGWE